jgi:hypothetical protein
MLLTQICQKSNATSLLAAVPGLARKRRRDINGYSGNAPDITHGIGTNNPAATGR